MASVNVESAPLVGRKTDQYGKESKKSHYTFIAITLVAVIAITLIVYAALGGFDSPVEPVTEEGALKIVVVDTETYPLAYCNDGSPGVFWYRLGNVTDKWMIHVNGGANCYSQETCESRWENTPQHMTSYGSDETKPGQGCYSEDPEVNPAFWDWNAITVLYCTSDLWTGNTSVEESGTDWSFRGHEMIDAIYRTIATNEQTSIFQNATEIILAGRGAGATGHIANFITEVALMSELAPNAKIRGLVDSGWQIDMPPYSNVTDCDDNAANVACSTKDMVLLAEDVWKPVLPQPCLNAYPEDEWWKCYYGLYSVPLHPADAPLFVNEFLNNDVLYSSLGDGSPETDEEIEYALNVSRKLLSEFDEVGITGYYSAACEAHGIITGNEWTWMHIDDVQLPVALGEWIEELNTVPSPQVHYVDDCEDFDPPMYCQEDCPPIY